MKNQYVGDINDYFKYAFLRSVASHIEDPLAVCWMLTPDDNGRDGRRRHYLEQPARFRTADPGLFDELLRISAQPEANILTVQEASILPGALFFESVLHDSASERERYFEEFDSILPQACCIFFDPDNGLEVQSTRLGRKGSSKYLYLDELQAIASDTRSFIVYQHFGRAERAAYISAQLDRLQRRLPHHELFAIAGSHIVFLVAASTERCAGLRCAAEALRRRWSSLRILATNKSPVKPA